MTEDILYNERISSKWTEALFLALMIIFLLLFVWHVTVTSLDILGVVLLCLSSIFLIYSLNYRILVIRLTPQSLKLTFGIFTWKLPLDNVADCRLDEIPLLMRMGGAGIHFMMIRQRYRASFNFLEYPRVVVAFKKKAGPVQDISFTTRQPDEVLRLMREAVSANRTA
jgi:drug/metabolite transporter superfamily protein YnfA